MDRFISLLKKELLGEISGEEKKILLKLIKRNTEYEGLYHELCSSNHQPGKAETLTEALEAYERHWLKMKRMNFLR